KCIVANLIQLGLPFQEDLVIETKEVRTYLIMSSLSKLSLGSTC
ncbi:7851_t:CDS:2, partial [Funneliformis mosseae]